MKRRFLLIALTFIASAVALGAFGAHALKQLLSVSQLNTFETAVRYQMYHGLGLLVVSVTGHLFQQKYWQLGQSLLVVGTLAFSLSLYLYLATGFRFLVFITPLGGSALILGWLWLIIAAYKGPEK